MTARANINIGGNRAVVTDSSASAYFAARTQICVFADNTFCRDIYSAQSNRTFQLEVGCYNCVGAKEGKFFIEHDVSNVLGLLSEVEDSRNQRLICIFCCFVKSVELGLDCAQFLYRLSHVYLTLVERRDFA